MKKYEHNGLPVSSVVGFLGLFAVMIALAISKETGVIEHDVAKRGVGVIFGLMLIVVGNLLPKFRLFDSPRRDPAQTHAAERFAGWVFVITGTAYSIIWAFVPMSSVMLVSSIVGLSSFALVASVANSYYRAISPGQQQSGCPTTGQQEQARGLGHSANARIEAEAGIIQRETDVNPGRRHVIGWKPPRSRHGGRRDDAGKVENAVGARSDRATRDVGELDAVPVAGKEMRDRECPTRRRAMFVGEAGIKL